KSPAREQQHENLLKNYYPTLAADGGNLLVVGDFNIFDDSPTYKSYTNPIKPSGALFTDSCLQSKDASCRITLNNGSIARVDYILYQSTMAVNVKQILSDRSVAFDAAGKPRKLSDHLPLIGTLEFAAMNHAQVE